MIFINKTLNQSNVKALVYLTFFVTILTSFVGGSWAQELRAQDQNRDYNIDLEIGAAAGFTPTYEGSNKLRATGFPIIILHFLRVPGLLDIGGGSDRGWSFAPSFRMLSQRSPSDDIRLFGLGKIDAALEVGGKAAYRWGNMRVFATLRKGFGGHTGWAGELGADFIAPIAPRWTLEAGPRLEFASASYMSKYFGVTSSQSVSSVYPIYNAGAGLKGLGAEAQLRYQINPKWAAVMTGKYIRLSGDAGRSPIVRAGSANSFSASLGLTYRFTTKFWNR